MRSPRRGRTRRIACAAAGLLLAGCETAARQYIHEQAYGGPGSLAILLRVTDPPGGPARAARLAEAEIAPFGGAVRRHAPPAAGGDLGLAPSYQAGTAGWVNLPASPGRHVLRLRARGAAGPEGEARFEFTVPGGAGVHYIGTFRRDCSAAGRPQRALARPYPPPLGAIGLAPPGTAALRVNAQAWHDAVNWDALTASERQPAQHGAGGPRSEAWPDEGAALRSVASMDFSGAGGAVGLIALPAAIVVAVPIALLIHGITLDVQRRRVEDAAREREERMAAFERARERWGACLAGIATALAPEAVERDLRAAPLHRAGPGPWQAEVARVLLRPCGAAGETRYGLEVMTRWTGRPAAAAADAFDAAYTRGVAGAIEDSRLRHPRRPPWELPVATEAACSPLAEWCGAEGAARLRAEILQGVTEAREGIAAGR